VNDFLGQLNLTVQERRIVMVIFAVVIVVLNYLFVWPRFGEWSRINKQLNDMRNTMTNNNRLILQDTNPTNGWRKLVAQYALKEGASVSEHPVDPQVQLQNAIMLQARKTGVNVQNYNPGSVKTNQFFEEHSTVISVESQEPQLISFLFDMGNDPAMIRVGKLDLKPADQNRYHLRGGITLTANYSRKPAAAVAPATPAKAGTPGAKPASATAKPATATTKPPPGSKPAAAPAPPGGRKGPLNAGSGPGPGPGRKPPPNLPPPPGRKQGAKNL
jgi:hypothetical protein